MHTYMYTYVMRTCAQIYRLIRKPFVACLSRIARDVKEEATAAIQQMGGTISTVWDKTCTMLVMDTFIPTSKLLMCLSAGMWICLRVCVRLRVRVCVCALSIYLYMHVRVCMHVAHPFNSRHLHHARL